MEIASRELATLHELPVLVVDDNQTNRTICEEMLDSWGMSATSVDSGVKCLEQFDRMAQTGRPYRLALIDVMMPKMDGFELVRQLRTRPAADSLAIIMLSSANRPEDKTLAAQLGVSRCMTKPITQSNLLNAITIAMGTARGDDAPTDSMIASRAVRFIPRKILLAEDGAVNRKVAVSLLEKRGHIVTAVENGKLAVDAVREGKFDLVLMDVQMPALDGFEATAEIRNLHSATGEHLPIIAMTAHAMKGDRERCLDAGMDDYVSKPFRPQELFAVVEKVKPAEVSEASVQSAPQPTSDATATNTNTSPPFDHERSLENVGGSGELLYEMIDLFAVEGPRQLAEIDSAFASGDSRAVMRAAHTLKGSVALFAATAATQAAKRIEYLGRDEKLEDYPAAMEDLRRLVAELLHALESLKSTGG